MTVMVQYWLLIAAVFYNTCLYSFIIFPSYNIRSQIDVRVRSSSNDAESFIFGGVKFFSPVSTGLRNLGIRNPSPIQNSSIAAITAGLSCILHAETGSGKTLAYLLPILKRFNYLDGVSVRPLQACIIVPTKELAVQVATDISSLLPNQNNLQQAAYLCITTTRSGLDQIDQPIVVGTPVKILDALRSSSSTTVNSFSYIVLDEVDRLLGSPSKYETAAEKREAMLNSNPTEQLLSLLVSGRTEKNLNAIQVVAASATVGRPLRRQLFSILQGGASFGDFPVLRPESDAIERKGPQSGSTRKIGVPNSIRHIAILVSDDDSADSKEDGSIVRKLVVVKKTWDSIPQASSRGLLFVPKYDDVKQTVGMLKFWGLSEVHDLQSTLGLNNPRPQSIATRPSQRDRKIEQVGQKMTSEEMIQQALQHGIGASSYLQRIATTGVEEVENAPTQENSSKRSLLQRIKHKRVEVTSEQNNQEELPLESTSQTKLQKRELLVVPVSGTRGLHIRDIEYVFITKPPRDMDEYLHMAGRTGRRGNSKATGTVITYVSLDEMKRLVSWQTPLGIEFEIKYEHQLNRLLD